MCSVMIFKTVLESNVASFLIHFPLEISFGIRVDFRQWIIFYCRSLTCKYQSLLGQATKQIEKLSCDKLFLEKDHNKLLVTNVELAGELKLLYSQQKEWRQIEKVFYKYDQDFSNSRFLKIKCVQKKVYFCYMTNIRK